jgi:hypothetical protein
MGLVKIAERIERAGHVAPQGRVSEQQFTLVAGAEYECVFDGSDGSQAQWWNLSGLEANSSVSEVEATR